MSSNDLRSQADAWTPQKAPLKILRRTVWTIVVLVLYWAANALYAPVGALMSAEMATRQFENSDSSFISMSYGLEMIGGVHTLFSALLLLVLILIWSKPIRNAVKNGWARLVTLLVVGVLFTGLQPKNVLAFATNGSDVKEFRSIEPDETAFLIPNFGENLNTQAQYKPEYLNSKDVKVPGKFINIPHTKLSGTGGASGLASVVGSDYWVNSATLVKVKRRQYSRVWVKPGRGTHKSVDESFNCQTKDGLNVKQIGITIIDLIEDKNAALYLSSFGLEPLDPKLDLTKIENIFVSVRNARSLIDVTDDVLYTEVHRLVCVRIGNWANPEVASENINTIMASVVTELTTFAADLGITIKTLGWGDSWTFDDDIQFAMNQKFSAKMVAGSLDILERNANINLKEGLGSGFRSKMPTTLFWGMSELLNAAIGAPKPPMAPAQ